MPKAKSPNEFDFESLQDSGSIVTYLEALAKGFKSGELQFSLGSHEMFLQPQGMLRFTVHARRKDDQVKVSFDVSWRERKKEPANDRLVIRPKRKKAQKKGKS